MSSDEQEHERLDVENDFEGGEWIGGEFFYQNKRQKVGRRSRVHAWIPIPMHACMHAWKGTSSDAATLR